MKSIYFINPLIFIFIFFAQFLNAQSLLQTYFNGNIDSMKSEAKRLILMPEPVFKQNNVSKMNASDIRDMGFEQPYKTEHLYFTLKDNKRIFAYRFPKESVNTVVLLHGVGSTAYLYNKTAGLLQEATGAEIYSLDMRGHGQSDGKPGDVEYINQYADDLAEIISMLRKEKPNGKIIIVGHSMGGGIALRFSMGNYPVKADAYILFAPLIGHDSPAMANHQSDNGADSTEVFVKIHFPRIIGLKMLNEINEHENDSLPVLFFNLPENAPLRSYSYRANMSMAPDQYKEALRKLKAPAIVLTGEKDEVFSEEAMKKAIVENSQAKAYTIENTTHNGVRHHPLSFQIIQQWFSEIR